MKTLALDLSTKSSGWAIFEDKNLIDYGCITASSDNVLNRIEKITKELRKVFEKHQPTNIIVEEVLPSDVKNNQKVFKALIYLQAATALEFNKDKIKLEFYTASEWRSKCNIRTGRGIKRESVKAADIQFVKDNYNIDANDDVCDAICIGHAYVNATVPVIINGFEFG